MNLQFGPGQGEAVARRAEALAGAAMAVVQLDEEDPELSSACGVEVCALEARTVLGSGVLGRVAAAASEARRGRPFVLSSEDVQALDSLARAVSRADTRIGLKRAALDAEASQEGIARFGGLLGLATGAVGFVKSFLG